MCALIDPGFGSALCRSTFSGSQNGDFIIHQLEYEKKIFVKRVGDVNVYAVEAALSIRYLVIRFKLLN